MDSNIVKNFIKSHKVLYNIARKIKHYVFILKLKFTGGLNIEATNNCAEITLIRNRKHQRAFFYPYSSTKEIDKTQLWILNRGLLNHLFAKYSHPECSMNSGEIVVDCGGFIGGFSMAAAENGAGRIVHIEPTPVTQRCALLNFNLHKFTNIESHQVGLGENNIISKFNLSRSFSDNSVLEPDSGGTGKVIEIELQSLDNLAKNLQLESNNTFLKIEAEGFEVEIVKGMNNFLPQKLVVDVTPERGGKSPKDEIASILQEKGYTNFYLTSQCLFASRSLDK